MVEEEKKEELSEEKKEVKPEEAQEETKEDAPKEVSEKKPAGKKPFKRRPRPRPGEPTEEGFIERVVKISRVSKVVKGGKNFSFSAMVVAGDGSGSVGVGHGKSNEVVEAIKKGTTDAKKNMHKINLSGDTIPHEVTGKFKATSVLLKPAGPGTGVIAGGPVRAMCDAAGIKNILTKSLGSRNAANVIKATMDGFIRLRLTRRS